MSEAEAAKPAPKKKAAAKKTKVLVILFGVRDSGKLIFESLAG